MEDGKQNSVLSTQTIAVAIPVTGRTELLTETPYQKLITPAEVLAITSGTLSATEMSAIVARAPQTRRWQVRTDRPWGLGDDFIPSPVSSKFDLETIPMGREGWYYRADGRRSYDTLRDAFVGYRLNPSGSHCGCISSYAFGTATVDCQAQLEFLREVMRQVLLVMPHVDVTALCDDLFAGQRHLCEHYLWWLENEGFVAHPVGEERQDRLTLTAEGCVALAMLEMTKPGSNIDMSPKAMHRMRQYEGLARDSDRPYFLTGNNSMPSVRDFEAERHGRRPG